MRYTGFLGASDQSQSVIANSERTINWFPELLPRNSKSQIALYPTPGFQALLTTPEIGGRALATMNDRTLAVIGSGVYGIDVPTHAYTLYGTVLQDGNPAQIAFNGEAGDQACVASGSNGYLLNLSTNALTTVLTGDCVQVGMMDGYFIAFDPVTTTFRLSNLNDGTTWDPTQFASRSAAPDRWKAMIVNLPDLWLIGERTGEVWYDAGAFPFPFAPRPGVNFKYGTPASFSVVAAGDTVLWLTQNMEGAGQVVMARGYSPQVVSTTSVEARIADYQRTVGITDCEGLAYQQDGHTFVNFRFPSAGRTETFDLTTGLWHERGKWISARSDYDVWAPRCHTVAAGVHVVGEDGTGQLSLMDHAYGREADGSVIRRQRVTASLFREHKLILIRVLEVLLEMGLGLITGQGDDPTAMLETSDDGGKTYGPSREARAGRIGQYRARMRFLRMGMSRDRVHRFTVSDPIPWRLIDAFINNYQDEG